MKLKGRALVQFFDAETGKEVLRHESHNILTNAAHHLLNGCPYGLDRRTWGALATETRETDWSDIYGKVLGGILIFPNAIAASATHLYEPVSNYPVGYGSMDGQDTSDSKSGTYNGVESGAVAGGFKWVYDFGSSQGNGTWNTISLTSSKGGYGYIDGRTDGSLFDEYFRRSTPSKILVGTTDDYLYFVADTYGAQQLSRLKLPNFAIPLYGNDITGSTTDILALADGDRVFIDTANKKIYTCSISGQNITIKRYDDEEDLTDVTTISLSITAGVTIPTYNRCALDFAVAGGFAYLGNRGTKVLKVDLSNAANVEELTVTEHTHAYSAIGISVLPTGDLYRHPNIIGADDSVHTIGGAVGTGASCENLSPVNVWMNRGGNFGGVGYGASILTPYLGTIFNLEATLTKDASKTAKISYTLTKSSS